MTPPSDGNNTSSAPPSSAPHAPPPPRPTPLHPFATPPAPAAATAAPNAITLLKALRRRLVPALTVGLSVAAIVGFATWFLMPAPKITARTQLHVELAAPSILFANTQGNNDSFMHSQAYLIKDRFVLNSALRLPEVAELSLIKEQNDPVQWLEKEIKVEFPSPEFMHITLSGDQPADQLKIVGAVTKAYLDGVVNQDHNQRQQKLENLKRWLTKFEDRSRTKRETLRQVQENHGAINEKSMAILQQVALEELHGHKKRLSEVGQELLQLRVEMGLNPDWIDHIWPQYAAALNGLPGSGLPINHAVVALLHDDAVFIPVDAHELDALMDKDKSLVEDLTQIQSLKARIENLREKVLPEAFEKMVQPERARLVALENAVTARREELRPLYREKYRKLLTQESHTKQAGIQEKYRKLKMTETALIESVTRLDEQTRQIRKNAVDLGQLLKDCEKDEKLMEMTADKLNAMEVEQEAPARITQPDKEAVLYTPDAAKRKLMATSGASAGSLALILLAFAWFEFQSRKVHSPEEVVEGLGLNLVGTVPDHSPRSWLPWSRVQEGNAAYTQSLLTESIDGARTMLLHIARLEKLQIVMITSALAGEGKTSLSSHLAASLARSGRRTLLLDSDLRNPTLHRLFDLSRAPGLSEFLRQEIDLTVATRATPIQNLWVISAGKADPISLQALAFDAIPKLFEKLRLQYDFIIVDSCPVLPVADSMLVGQHVDAVIFSLLRDVSRMPRVHAAYQRLALLGIRMLGAVINGTHHDRYPADYHYISQDG